MENPNPKSVARRYASASRVKTAGEVRFVKDRSGDKGEWGWNTTGPSQREIGEDFVFNAKYLKPLAKVLRSSLMALGHATSAHARLVKVKSRNVSPDGALGGKGYIQKIPDMRRQLMNCVEVLSAITDTVYDELHASHWNPAEDTLSPRDRDEVREIVEDAEEIKDDPEAWADEQEEELAEESVGKTASLRAPLTVQAIDTLAMQAEKVRDLLSVRGIEAAEEEVHSLVEIAWDLHKKASGAAQAAEKVTISRPRAASVASRYTSVRGEI